MSPISSHRPAGAHDAASAAWLGSCGSSRTFLPGPDRDRANRCYRQQGAARASMRSSPRGWGSRHLATDPSPLLSSDRSILNAPQAVSLDGRRLNAKALTPKETHMPAVKLSACIRMIFSNTPGSSTASTSRGMWLPASSSGAGRRNAGGYQGGRKTEASPSPPSAAIAPAPSSIRQHGRLVDAKQSGQGRRDGLPHTHRHHRQ